MKQVYTVRDRYGDLVNAFDTYEEAKEEAEEYDYVHSAFSPFRVHLEGPKANQEGLDNA